MSVYLATTNSNKSDEQRWRVSCVVNEELQIVLDFLPSFKVALQLAEHYTLFGHN